MAFVRKDALERACKKLGVKVDQVIAHTLDDESITLVVDKGIKGAPKFKIKFDDLPDLDPPVKQAARKRTKTTK